MKGLRMLFGVVLLLGLAACGDREEQGIPADAPQTLDTGGPSDHVKVSRSLRFGSVNPAIYGVLGERGQVDAFEKAVRSAQQMPGILDVVQPDYDVVIERDGKRREIHLWLDAKSEHGMYTDVADTGTGYKLTSESTRELYALIWGIRYEPKQAEANGDVVKLGDELSNREIWDRFVKNVKAGVRDEVQVVQYTIEGGPIFDNLFFDGSTIMHKYDNTHDAFGTPIKRFNFCKSVELKETKFGEAYVLGGCSEGDDGSGSFYLPIGR